LSRSFNLMIADLAAAREQLTAKSEAEINKQYERLDMAINSMPQGLCMFDADQKLIVSNRRFAEMYGLPPEQTAPGTSLQSILKYREATSVGSDYAENCAEDRMRAVASGKPWRFVHELPDGRVIVLLHVPLPGGGSIATHEDITERRDKEVQMAYMAPHDMPTNMPNRGRFREDVCKRLSRVYVTVLLPFSVWISMNSKASTRPWVIR
jgi:PAS domain-containing protein